MPTSRYDPSDTLVPETPDGYRRADDFRYSLLLLFGMAVVVIPVSIALFGSVLWYAQGPEALATVFQFEETPTSVSFTIESSTVGVAILGAIFGVTVLHELVHGAVYGLRGYDVSYGIAPNVGAVYAAAFHQFQRRDDNLLVGIAPLVVLDLLLLPVLFVPVPLVAFGAFVALLINTVGAVGDIYLIARLLRMPAGTLLYDSNIRQSFVFVPKNGSS
jgi:hypothetical protein